VSPSGGRGSDWSLIEVGSGVRRKECMNEVDESVVEGGSETRWLLSTCAHMFQHLPAFADIYQQIQFVEFVAVAEKMLAV
jgi:hypothetical protein